MINANILFLSITKKPDQRMTPIGPLHSVLGPPQYDLGLHSRAHVGNPAAFVELPERVPDQDLGGGDPERCKFLILKKNNNWR